MGQTRAIDFGTLTLRDAMDLAVLVEEEAKDRYGELVDQMKLHHNAEAEQFFRSMLHIEDGHERKLAERRKQLFGDAPRTVRLEMLFDVEAPEYDEARATMTVRQAFEMALQAETKSGEFYEGVAAATKDAEARALFEELRQHEKEHCALVEKAIAKLPPEAALRAEDVDDGPVAL